MLSLSAVQWEGLYMSKEILRMEGITKIYSNGFMANKDVSFSINSGEIHALIGENGAGKTTLMKILFGLEVCQSGTIYMNGEPTKIMNPLDAIAKGVGMVHQHFMQMPDLTVAENIILGIEPGRYGLYNGKKAVEMTLEASAKYRLDVNPNDLIRNISVGQKQKVELLKALIRGAKILILDEPTAVLTPQETRKLFEQLSFLKESGYAVVFISHKLEEIMEICDRVTVLRHGRVAGYGEIKDLDELKLSNMIVGRDVVLEIEKSRAERGASILRVEHLNYLDDNGKAVISGLSMGIRSGEIVGIAGVEGNGQTELSEIITGMRRATEGPVSINGSEISHRSIRKIRDLGVAHISEDRMKYGCAAELSIRDNIASVYLDRKEFRSGLFVNKKKINKFVEQCIKDFEISCGDGSEAIRMLSGGNIQKVIVAREFCCGANLIVANQPTRGIDVGTSDLIRRQIIKQSREKGIGVLLISSDLNEVLEVSDRLLIMKDGEIVAQFMDPKSVTDDMLGEYMLGIKHMTTEEMGDLF